MSFTTTQEAYIIYTNSIKLYTNYNILYMSIAVYGRVYYYYLYILIYNYIIKFFKYLVTLLLHAATGTDFWLLISDFFVQV